MILGSYILGHLKPDLLKSLSLYLWSNSLVFNSSINSLLLIYLMNDSFIFNEESIFILI